MSTMAHPGRYTYCIGEHEEENPWDSLAVEHGFAPGDSTVAAFAGEAPHGVYDHQEPDRQGPPHHDLASRSR